MKEIDRVVEVLKQIPNATVPAKSPNKKPRIIELPATRGKKKILLDVDDVDYPEYLEQEIFSNLDKSVKGKVDNSVSGVGIDALAWYSSFHYVGGEWGIFIPITSLAYFESRVLKDADLSRSEKWNSAISILFEHEIIHFAVDYVCAQWEILLGAPSRTSFARRLKQERVPYLAKEEMVANANMLRRCKSKVSKESLKNLESFVASQPSGYRDAFNAIEDDEFHTAFNDSVLSYIGIHSLERRLAKNAISFSFFNRLPTDDELKQCPVYVLGDETDLGLPKGSIRFIERISASQLEETDSFRKQLSKLDRSLQKSWEKLKKKMESGLPADFEKLKGRRDNVFSMRLNDNFRVHLRPEKSGKWTVFEVGSHKAMGHG